MFCLPVRHHVCAWCPQRPEESAETEVGEVPWGRKLNPRSLQEQSLNHGAHLPATPPQFLIPALYSIT